ncbi:MAG: macro domain-containing protein, partial [Actinobacteria bacterium]|nr:macro domain-containing protein [Actinomycetota bacterium]
MPIKYKIGNSILELIAGDITRQYTEAIVNAANKQLSPGGGVSGAIHRAAGPQLWEECKTLGGCNTGEAKLTSGYNLKAKYVIHTVGPVYSNSISDPEYLKDCYKNCLLL